MDRLIALIESSAAEGCSDIHLCTARPPILRRDGHLAPQPDGPAALASEAVSGLIGQLMGVEAAERIAAGGDVDGSVTLNGGTRLRLHGYRSADGPCLAVRPIGSAVPRLEEIGAPAGLAPLLDRRAGLILVTGATGSGKSTTLAAMLRAIAERRACHILTIEDPIEFVHAGSGGALINQREIGRDAPDFNAALRSALRADPDVLMVGELRDLDTIRLALSAAETGHLVLSTLHTNSAAKTVDRLLDAFPANEKPMVRAQLSTSLLAVLAQTLLPRLSGGRIAAFELLVASDAIRNLIRENELHQIPNMQQMGARHGMTTMEGEIKRLVARQEVAQADAAIALGETAQDGQDRQERGSALDPEAGAMLSTRSY